MKGALGNVTVPKFFQDVRQAAGSVLITSREAAQHLTRPETGGSQWPVEDSIANRVTKQFEPTDAQLIELVGQLWGDRVKVKAMARDFRQKFVEMFADGRQSCTLSAVVGSAASQKAVVELQVPVDIGGRGFGAEKVQQPHQVEFGDGWQKNLVARRQTTAVDGDGAAGRQVTDSPLLLPVFPPFPQARPVAWTKRIQG